MGIAEPHWACQGVFCHAQRPARALAHTVDDRQESTIDQSGLSTRVEYRHRPRSVAKLGGPFSDSPICPSEASVSDPKSISVEAANDLMQQGYVYVDVRSEPEFENAHVPGALNIPLAHHTPQGMQPNPEFLSVMEGSFGKHEKLILGCKSGGRSKRALALLVQAGF